MGSVTIEGLRDSFLELWEACLAKIETAALVDAGKLEQRVVEQAKAWGTSLDTPELIRLILYCARDLHPLPARFDRQVSQLNLDDELSQQLLHSWTILPHRLVEEHWALVKKAAARYHIPTSLENEAEFQELLSVGREALFLAAQKYYRRPRGDFRNFAWHQIKDKIREEQGQRHPVPPRIRKKLSALAQLRDDYTLADRTLDRQEIQRQLKLNPEELVELLQIEAIWGNGQEFETDVVLEDLEEPDHSLDQLAILLEIEDAQRLDQALRHVEEPARTVIQKLYFEEKTLREVATELELSLPAFKKLHKQALAEVKKKLLSVV
jgi:RNA polymerase sigma factor for flagellar operon FliA